MKSQQTNNNSTDAKKEIELDINQEIAKIENQIDRFADIIIVLLLNGNYDNENQEKL